MRHIVTLSCRDRRLHTSSTRPISQPHVHSLILILIDPCSHALQLRIEMSVSHTACSVLCESGSPSMGPRNLLSDLDLFVSGRSVGGSAVRHCTGSWSRTFLCGPTMRTTRHARAVRVVVVAEGLGERVVLRSIGLWCAGRMRCDRPWWAAACDVRQVGWWGERATRVAVAMDG